MYLKHFSEPQKRLFLNIAYVTVVYDRVFSKQEREYMRDIEDEIGMTCDLATIDMDFDNVLQKAKIFFGVMERRILVYEVMGLSMADDDFGEAERSVIKMMAKTFELDQGFIDFCEERLRQFKKFKAEVSKVILAPVEE